MTIAESKTSRTSSDLPRRILRTLVPASLAGGIMALYPAISESVVDRLGSGFEPKLVALYVSTLLLLFFADAWVRDRKLARLARAAALSEQKAEGLRQRADELHLVLEIATELDGQARIESSLYRLLERLRSKLTFAEGYVFLHDTASHRLSCRGISPLTCRPTDELRGFAEQTAPAAEAAAVLMIHSDPDHSDRIACPIPSRGRIIGLLVLCGTPALGLHEQARLLAIADRLGAALNGLLLLAELDQKERALRNAYRELRLSGARLARSSAAEEAALLGRATSNSLVEPLSRTRQELRSLERALPRDQRDGPVAEHLESAHSSVERIERVVAELRELGRHTGQPSELVVNDAVVAALDLALPDLKRAGIDVRMSLDSRLPPIRMDESLLVQLLTRLLRSARASLRKAIEPRRLSVETRAYGEGVKVLIKDNSAGVSSGGVEQVVRKRNPAAQLTPLQSALRHEVRERYRVDFAAQGIDIRCEQEVGRGRTLIVCLRGVRNQADAELTQLAW